jgi:hypothetical protein
MKAGAYLLAFIWCVLIIEPIANANYSGQTTWPSCHKTQEAQASCSRTKASSSCHEKSRPDGTENRDDCERNQCNPLMSCPGGNFYVFGNSHFSLPSPILLKQKPIAVNDNRISQRLSECWHPPEMI